VTTSKVICRLKPAPANAGLPVAVRLTQKAGPGPIEGSGAPSEATEDGSYQDETVEGAIVGEEM
jgi:hypothetical protein